MKETVKTIQDLRAENTSLRVELQQLKAAHCRAGHQPQHSGVDAAAPAFSPEEQEVFRPSSLTSTNSLPLHNASSDVLNRQQSPRLASYIYPNSTDFTAPNQLYDDMKRELTQLRDRYKDLLLEKEQAQQRYETHYRKWKEFKRWLFQGEKVSSRGRGSAAYERRLKQCIRSGKASPRSMKENIPLPPHPPSALSPPCNENDRTKSAFSPHLQSTPGAVDDDVSELMPVSSETEDDSQAPDPIFPFQRFTLTTCRSHSPKAGRTAVLASHWAVNGKPHLPLTPVANTDVDDQVKKAESIAALQDYETFKGRGRYASELQGNETINARYRIDSAHNEGANFAFEDVVRGKQQRKHLPAVDCECCREYYEAIGPLPPRLQPPLWRSPPSTPCLQSRYSRTSQSNKRPHSHVSYDDDDSPEQLHTVARHKNEISRHRQQWERPTTPPGYWDIGFPDTQEAELINKKAEEMHKRKKAAVEMEAIQGGRYQKQRHRPV